MTDDDIPVLTHVLRTGNARGLPPLPPRLGGTPQEPAAAEHPEARPPDPVPADPLVIGNEPRPPSAPGGLVSPFDDDDEAHDPARYAVTDASPEAPRADSFRLPQDHDSTTIAGAANSRFDEPEIGRTAINPPDDPDERAAHVDAQPDRRRRPFVSGLPRERRIHPFARDEVRERRTQPFVADDPRERRQGFDDLLLRRHASITVSVRDAVLVALQARIDTELDARIAQALHAEIETAIAHLQDRLRDRLSEALRDVVDRAIDDEVTRFVTEERDAAARLDPRKPPGRPGT